jgi:hypothetical protein
MNKDKVRKIVYEIIESWNKGDFKSRRYAVNKLKLSRWFLSIKTYNFVAEKIGVEKLLDIDELDADLKKKENKNILIKAKNIFGGKIIK